MSGMGITDKALLQDVMSKDGITNVTFRCKCGSEIDGHMKNYEVASSRVEMNLDSGDLYVDVASCEKCV